MLIALAPVRNKHKNIYIVEPKKKISFNTSEEKAVSRKPESANLVESRLYSGANAAESVYWESTDKVDEEGVLYMEESLNAEVEKASPW